MSDGNFLRSQVISGGIETFAIEECFATENDMRQLRDMVLARQRGEDLIIVKETAPKVLSIAISILSSMFGGMTED